MIAGLIYIHEFVTEEEQKSLIETIDSLPWLTDLKRRTQHYGYKYDYTKKQIDSSMFLGPIPEWIQPFSKRLVDLKHFDKLPDQVIVNEYLPGQGISRHRDCVPCFGDTIASLSLGSPCLMEFEHIGSSKVGGMMLGPRSLLILTGEARYDWMHAIPARREDTFRQETFVRGRRVSLTFRTIKHEGQIPVVH